ncbi:hypothetical protein D0V57_22480 [Salmonella enterica]|nr:hypothetical protein [Salmonella enterica]
MQEAEIMEIPVVTLGIMMRMNRINMVSSFTLRMMMAFHMQTLGMLHILRMVHNGEEPRMRRGTRKFLIRILSKKLKCSC